MARPEHVHRIGTTAAICLAVSLMIAAASCSASTSKSALIGSWTLSNFTNRTGAVDASIPPATIEFSKDGKVTGGTGCNRFTGEWSAQGTDLKFAAVAMTVKACDDSGGTLTAQESVMEIMFSKPQTFSIDGDRLTIGAADSSISATFTRD